MIADKILEIKLINQYNKMYNIFAQNNVLKLNLSEDNIIQGLIQDVKSDNVNSTYKKEIITNYGVLKTGDYVSCTSNGKSITYIVESQVDKEIGCDKAYLTECPFSINIFDWNYTDILIYPIALKNNNASLGVTESVIAITPNSSFDIIMKYDIHTRSFIQSDNIINGVEHAKISRVLIDGMAFKVVGVNHLISKGLLVISIETGTISPNDNLDLGVADYTTYYREPIDYNALIDTEILKYETDVMINKTVLANDDVTNIVKKLKVDQIANADINVSVTNVDIDGLLTLNNGVVTLTNQIPFESIDNTTTTTLTFSMYNVSKTLLVAVNIEKQDKIITDEDIVISEMPKYKTTATITKDILAGTDITSTILKLKAGQASNPEVTTYISAVDVDGLLTLTGNVVSLTDIIPYSATDNTTTAIITFIKNATVRTLLVDVTIEKQAQPQENLIIDGYPDICISDTNTYTINTTKPVTWNVTNISGGITLATSGTSNTCNVTCAYGVQYIGYVETLTATVDGVDYTKTIEIISLA